MRCAEPDKVQSAINVTPLVDVVLVLLIIFMVLAPQLDPGHALQLPTTDRPPSRPDDGRQLQVAVEHDGTVWIEGRRVSAEQFPASIRAAAERHAGCRVVVQGDARLSFGDVRRTLLAVEAAGFHDVGLIAERPDAARRRG